MYSCRMQGCASLRRITSLLLLEGSKHRQMQATPTRTTPWRAEVTCGIARGEVGPRGCDWPGSRLCVCDALMPEVRAPSGRHGAYVCDHSVISDSGSAARPSTFRKKRAMQETAKGRKPCGGWGAWWLRLLISLEYIGNVHFHCTVTVSPGVADLSGHTACPGRI